MNCPLFESSYDKPVVSEEMVGRAGVEPATY